MEDNLTMRKPNLLGVTLVVSLMMAPLALRADSMSLNGAITITPDNTLGSCAAGATACQDVAFTAVTVVNPVAPSSDAAIIGAPVTLPDIGLGWNGATVTFYPSTSPFSISYGANTLSGYITWQSLSGPGAGAFQFDLGLSNLASVGTDQIFNDFAAYGGSGTLSFQFPSGPQDISQLFQNTSTQQTAVLGTISTPSATPEPSGMALMSEGLMGLGVLAYFRLRRYAK